MCRVRILYKRKRGRERTKKFIFPFLSFALLDLQRIFYPFNHHLRYWKVLLFSALLVSRKEEGRRECDKIEEEEEFTKDALKKWKNSKGGEKEWKKVTVMLKNTTQKVFTFSYLLFIIYSSFDLYLPHIFASSLLWGTSRDDDVLYNFSGVYFNIFHFILMHMFSPSTLFRRESNHKR